MKPQRLLRLSFLAAIVPILLTASSPQPSTQTPPLTVADASPDAIWLDSLDLTRMVQRR